VFRARRLGGKITTCPGTDVARGMHSSSLRRARDAIETAWALPVPVASTGIPGGAVLPPFDPRIHPCMHAPRQRREHWRLPNVRACVSSARDTVKLDMGVGSTCVRRAPTERGDRQ